ncbi:MAG TPA: FtsX-like permease family protein [Dissulfurispiraceae bacterium]
MRRPRKNMVIALSIIIAVALLTSLSIVSNSANQAIMEIIAKTGHTLTVRPAASAKDAGASGKGQEYKLTTSEVILGSYIPEEAIPEIMNNYDKAIKAGWEKRGGLVASPGIPEVSIEPPTWAPRLFEKANVDGREAIVTGVELRKEYFVRFWWNLTSGEWPEDTDIRDVNTSVTTMYKLDSHGNVVTDKTAYGVDSSGRIVAMQDRKTGKRAAPAEPVQKGWDGVYLGGTYAKARGLKLGDSLTINKTEFTVRGILEETNSADDTMVFIPLKTAQRIFHKEGLVSLLSVRAMCPNCPVGDAMVDLNKHVTGITAVSQLDVAGVQFDFFNMLYKFLLAVVVSTIAVGIFSIFNIVTGSLYARIREIGMLKAIGASRFQLLRIFIYEHFILGLGAGIIGYLLGLGMAYGLNTLLDIGAVIRINPDFLPRALILGIVCSLAAILYPAYKLSRLKITETFRTQWES